ncbi:hypothetical protein ACIP9H_24550 [Streptomyces sp. NPDC088732]|uniref:hypothetical protein n=1 Tax=Streptomyces sp. NPDC088732 TaxID=3365879 RepID=UPI003803AD74
MWGRLLGREGPAAGGPGTGDAAAGERQPAPPPRGEWRGLAVQRSTFGVPALVSAPDAFKAGLSTWQNPSFSAGTLGHFVSEAAPGGVVHGVAEPAAPVQRTTTDLPVRQAVRVGPAAEAPAPAPVQRQVRPEAPAGRFTVARAVELPVRTLPAERAASDVPSAHVPEETVPDPVPVPEPAAVERPLVGERAPLMEPAPEAVSAPEPPQVPAPPVPDQAPAPSVQRARPLGLGAPLSSVPLAPPVQRLAAPDPGVPVPGSRPKLGRIGEPLTQVPVPPARTTAPEAAPLAPLLGESGPLVQRQEVDTPAPQRVPAATGLSPNAVAADPPARVSAPVVVMDVPPVRIQRLVGPEATPEAPDPGPVAGLLGDRGLELRSVPTPSEPAPVADAPAALRVVPLVWSRPEGTVASGTADGRATQPVQLHAGDPPGPQAPRGGTPPTAPQVAATPPRAERASVQRSAAPLAGPVSTTPVAEPFRTERAAAPSVPVGPVPVPAAVQRYMEPSAGLPVVVPEPVPATERVPVPLGRPSVPVGPPPASVQRYAEPSAGLPVVVPGPVSANPVAANPVSANPVAERFRSERVAAPSVPVGPVPVPAAVQRHAEPSAGLPDVPVAQRYAGQPTAATGGPFAVQRLNAPPPPPRSSVTPLQLSAPGTAPGDPGSVAVAAGIAQRAADGSVVFAPPAPVPAVAQRETDAPPPEPAPAPTAAPITPAPAPAAAPSPEPPKAESTDELVHRLLAPLSRLLRAELRLDRERAGLRLDSRH